jgi:hypothetical protein
MAEIRKFDPAAGSAIAQALKAAMGEPVRPHQPGASRPEPSRPVEEAPPPAVVTLNIKTVVVPADDDED